jgi:hypothetical protein
MITRVAFTLTDEERRRISGKKRPATRKEITDFVTRLVAHALQRELAPPPVAATTEIDPQSLACTTLDHLYPLGPKTAETPCYCGRRTWGGSRPAAAVS